MARTSFWGEQAAENEVLFAEELCADAYSAAAAIAGRSALTPLPSLYYWLDEHKTVSSWLDKIDGQWSKPGSITRIDIVAAMRAVFSEHKVDDDWMWFGQDATGSNRDTTSDIVTRLRSIDGTEDHALRYSAMDELGMVIEDSTISDPHLDAHLTRRALKHAMSLLRSEGVKEVIGAKAWLMNLPRILNTAIIDARGDAPASVADIVHSIHDDVSSLVSPPALHLLLEVTQPEYGDTRDLDEDLDVIVGFMIHTAISKVDPVLATNYLDLSPYRGDSGQTFIINKTPEK